MKVCMVSKHYYPYMGGLESRVQEIAEWLAKEGHEVTVLTTFEENTEKNEIINDVTVRRSHHIFSVSNSPFAPGIFDNLLLRSKDYDIIDVNLPDAFLSSYAWFALWFLGVIGKKKSLYVTYHADIIREKGIPKLLNMLYSATVLKLVLCGAEKIFVTSPNYVESSSTLKNFMDKVVVAPSFVDADKFNPRLSGSKVREKHKLGDKPLVLFVGRLVGYKGLDQLLTAFKELVGVRDTRLLIVGDGPLRQELEGQAESLGVADGVVFAGQVSDEELPTYYAACDVFVLPSVTRQEAFGLVLVEAMACGKPVVSTDFSGMPFVVGDAGLLVEPGDPVALSKALGQVLGDRGQASELGARGRERVLEMFERDVVCAAVEAVYKSTVLKN